MLSAHGVHSCPYRSLRLCPPARRGAAPGAAWRRTTMQARRLRRCGRRGCGTEGEGEGARCGGVAGRRARSCHGPCTRRAMFMPRRVEEGRGGGRKAAPFTFRRRLRRRRSGAANPATPAGSGVPLSSAGSRAGAPPPGAMRSGRLRQSSCGAASGSAARPARQPLTTGARRALPIWRRAAPCPTWTRRPAPP